MHKRMLIQAATALVALQFFAVPVFAAGSSGGSDQTVTQCKKGEVWDKKKKKCVAPQEGMDEVAALFAGAETVIGAEQFRILAALDLVEQMKGDRRHRPLVRLARPVDVEVAQPGDL